MVYERITNIHPEGNPIHEVNLAELREKPKKILDFQIAKVIDFRDREYPLGFRNIKELSAIRDLLEPFLRVLLPVLRLILRFIWLSSYNGRHEQSSITSIEEV